MKSNDRQGLDLISASPGIIATLPIAMAGAGCFGKVENLLGGESGEGRIQEAEIREDIKERLYAISMGVQLAADEVGKKSESEIKLLLEKIDREVKKLSDATYLRPS